MLRAAKMRLTILGGSGASPNPGMGCAGLLVETGDTRLVLDLGPGTLQELRKHTDFRALDAVVISHMHVDHVLDLLALRHALAYNPVPAPGPIPVWLPPGGSALLAAATAPFDACDKPRRFTSTVEIDASQLPPLRRQ
jgi:ribonuclease BN (tRNA processing enzyme)